MADQLPLLTSWKEIAAYLKSSVRTCQKYEAKMGLPVHRLDGSPKAHVFAYRGELDAWLSEKGSERQQTESAASPGPKSVAVLPFVDIGIEGSSEHLAAGIPEAVIDILCRIPGLHVPMPASASVVQKRGLSLRDVGQVMSVGHVLEGSVQVTGDRLRVTAQLSKVTDGTQIWEDKFDRKIGDVFDIQDEIAMAIVDKLAVTLLSKDKVFSRKRPTTDTEAYALYLKGRFFITRPSAESELKALTFFEAALDRDPTFARAYVSIAIVHAFKANTKLMPAAVAYTKVASAVKRALVLDPDLAEAHGLGAVVDLCYKWDLAAAEKGFLRALELKPGDSLIRGYYAWTLLAQRRFEEARVEIRRALAADPLMPLTYYRAIDILGLSGFYEEALEIFSKCRDIDPNFGLAYFAAGRVYRRLGRFDEAMEAAEKSRRLSNFPHLFDSDLIDCYARKGDRAQAGKLLADMLEARKTFPVPPITLAGAYFALGDLDGALDWLETAIRERTWEASHIRVLVEYLYPDAAASPRFQSLCDRFSLPR